LGKDRNTQGSSNIDAEMGANGEALLIVSDPCYPAAVERAFDAADHSSEPVQAGVEAVVAMAESNPEGARAALWRLQTDWPTLKRCEEHLGGEPTAAALRIGAAIQLARAELASPAPQLRRLLPELMEWLGRRELGPTD
jgi:hypothetical protein